jgi:N-methylhydantoinase A
MLASGPAGGVLASAALARRLGYPNVITSDMGGTSFDVGMIVDGEPLVAITSVDGGYHLVAPRIQITAVGSGGGSIASVDQDGMLTVGPRSAGAVPGPACYSRGGTLPTVTDADVTLGIIDPTYFLGGRVPLDRDLAVQAISEHVATPLGLPVDAAAAGIRSVVDNQMADLLRNVTIQQGSDPREFVLFAYGGAGPTHAYSFALEAGISTIVVPYAATVNSAFGAVSSDRFRSLQVSDPQRTPPRADRPAAFLDVDRINRTFAELTARCRAELNDHPDLVMGRQIYFRFRKQTHELPVAAPERDLTVSDLDELIHEFHAKYERIYGEGTSLPEAGVEINTFRVEGRIPTYLGQVVPDTQAGGSVEAALLGTRQVIYGQTRHETKVYRGDDLPTGTVLAGPAIMEFPGTTVVVGPDQQSRMDDERNIIITASATPRALNSPARDAADTQEHA